MSGFSEPQQIDGSLEQLQFELDGYMVTFHAATVVPTASDWQFSLWDDQGNQIYDYQEFQGASGSGLFDIDNVWHVRDDGGGAFTVFYLSDTLNSRTGTMQSFDSNGNSIAVEEYEMPTQTLDFGGGVVIEQTILEAYHVAVDLDGGAFAAFNHDASLGTEHNVVIYNADGTIDTRVNWDATYTGTGSATIGGLDMVASGDNLFVFHLNTGLGGDNEFEVYGRVVDTAGNFVTDEFRVSEGDHEQGTFGFGSGGLDAETLIDGKVVVAYVTSKVGTSDTGTLDVFYKIFNPDGSVFAGEQLANIGFTDQQQGQARVHALADGGFAITYNTNDYTALVNTGVTQCFDSDGNPVGDPTVLPDRFDAADTSVIFENGFGYISGAGTDLYTSSADVGDTGGGGGPITGTAGNDDLVGTSGNDEIKGLDGADTLTGKDGKDDLLGGKGGDSLSGGKGKDTLSGQKGKDTLKGGDGDDDLSGGEGNDRLETGAGADTASGGTGDDTIIGGDGDELLLGDDGKDKLKGGKGKDTLEGGKGNDDLSGAKGKDDLQGGKGADTLDGGEGNDKLKGGAQSDTFVWSGGADKVKDFDALDDKEVVDLSGVAEITGFNDLKNNHMTQSGADVVIDDLGGNTLTLQNVDLADLDKIDFLF